ncbi:hypothetical protein SUDANB120_05311 [Streptomyces sp. enrichment culture]
MPGRTEHTLLNYKYVDDALAEQGVAAVEGAISGITRRPLAREVERLDTSTPGWFAMFRRLVPVDWLIDAMRASAAWAPSPPCSACSGCHAVQCSWMRPFLARWGVAAGGHRSGGDAPEGLAALRGGLAGAFGAFTARPSRASAGRQAGRLRRVHRPGGRPCAASCAHRASHHRPLL